MGALRALLAAGVVLASASPLAAEYREIAVKDGGSIAGQVRVVGEVSPLPPQPVFKHHETCGAAVADERLVVAPGGGLANAIVYLKDVKVGKAAPRDQQLTMDNRKCAFVPHVLTATIGQKLAIHNSDPFLHDAHAQVGTRTLFNRALVQGRTVTESLDEIGLVHVNCNVRHTWMHAYILVAEHPYHTVTGADGLFRLDGIPPGIYTLGVWHELLGSRDLPVTVSPDRTTTVEVEFPAAAPESP